METFPLNTAPDWGLQSSPTADIEEQKLGDGYVLRRAKGLNHLRESWTPSWSFLTEAEAESNYAWLKQRMHLTPFLWTHPTENIAYKVVCKSVSKVVTDVGIFALRATFEQDFNA